MFAVPWRVSLLLALLSTDAAAITVSPQTRARLAAGQNTQVIVEIDGSQTDTVAAAERLRRNLKSDDASILELRARGYAATKAAVEAAAAASDASRVRDYRNLPMSVWRLASIAALERLLAQPAVRAVYEDVILHVDSVSDLSFIDQPQAGAEGANGAGTAIAIIDGGLGSNYLDYPDFGTCTAVNTPSGTCRVVYNQDFYPGQSAEIAHGTNVSAIALGVAPDSKLAMFDIFNGSGASTSDIITAMDTIISAQSTYNIVAVNLSLGDGTSNPSQCSDNPFASAVNGLANAGVMTIAAAGNSGSKAGLSVPACVQGVVSVGAAYNAAYGSLTWVASADTGGTCTDGDSAADQVMCFSQSSNYLTVLGPGSFVSAPNSSFDESGTSQATPHITGSVAVLRARYPAEPMSQTVKRLTDTGVEALDSGNNLTRPRVNLLAAANEGTAVTLSGTGPVQATAGGTGTYTVTARNAGPLIATDVQINDSLPAGAAVSFVSSGCSYVSGAVACTDANLAVGASVTFTIVVNWSVSGPVYDSAVIRLDQNDSASGSQQQVAFGTAPQSSDGVGDAPLPIWAYGLLGLSVVFIARHRLRLSEAPH